MEGSGYSHKKTFPFVRSMGTSKLNQNPLASWKTPCDLSLPQASAESSAQFDLLWGVDDERE